MQGNPVVWFELPAIDLERAKTFYEKIFGFSLQISETGPMKMVFFPKGDGTYGISGALIKGDCFTPSRAGALVYFGADNIDETLKKVNASGGKTLLPKMSIGEYGFIAHFEDSEGNRVGLHRMA